MSVNFKLLNGRKFNIPFLLDAKIRVVCYASQLWKFAGTGKCGL